MERRLQSRSLRAAWVRLAVIFALGLASSPTSARAEPTTVTVRALAKGAKFIGDGMGGVRVIIRDAESGEVLAQGVTRGGTGDTSAIMSASRTRRDPISTPDAAAFTATLELDEPRRVEIIAYGPLAKRQAAARASITHWLVPGQSITGDGIVLELPGFVVDVLAPAAHQTFDRPPGQLELRANVVLMCGCPLTPRGRWDADQVSVTAVIKRDGRVLRTVRLRYAGKPNQFTAKLRVDQPGAYEVTVIAIDQKDSNTGVDATTFVIGG
jgi:hypothetical protein